MEPPVYVEGFQQRLRHWYTATNGDAVHRFPIRYAEIWNQYAAIPDTPDAGLINDGDTAGVVELRKALPLVLLSGGGEAPTKFQLAATPADMSQVITATTGLDAPVAGSAAPTLLNAPADGYTPVIEDVAGNVFPMQASTWVADGLNHFVEFPRGVPAEMAPPFTLTFFRYVGITGGNPPDDPIWHYVADVLALSPTGEGATIGADFAAPLTGAASPSTEGAGTKIVYDAGPGTFRAGTVSGAQWDAASRGAASLAAGTDGTAAGANGAVIGGADGAVAASAARSAVLGGNGEGIAGQTDTMVTPRQRSAGGRQVRIRQPVNNTVLDLDYHVVVDRAVMGFGVYIVRLPATPVPGQSYVVKYYFTSFLVEIQGNGNVIDNNNGGTSLSVLRGTARGSVRFVWSAAENLWLTFGTLTSFGF